jgi:hypothetical protein
VCVCVCVLTLPLIVQFADPHLCPEFLVLFLLSLGIVNPGQLSKGPA